MSIKLYPLEVAEVRMETSEAVSIHFDLPEEHRSEFAYLPGQYLTLEIKNGDKNIRRCYSLCSSPYSGEKPAVAVKRVAGGVVSNFLNDEVKAGDVIQVIPPLGVFNVKVDPERQINYVLFAGGSGITPIMSIIKSVLLKEPGSRILLIYANRNEHGIIFRKELDDLKTSYTGRLEIIHNLDNPIAFEDCMKGMLTEGRIKAILEDNPTEPQSTEYYICGPSGFMELIENTLRSKGVADEKINKEYFVMEKSNEVVETAAEGMPADGARVFVNLDGERHEITVKPNETILEAAIDANIDPPYACMSASCSTCRAKLLKGEVTMDDRDILSDEEIEEGYILTCQSHPTTAEVELDYDDF